MLLCLQQPVCFPALDNDHHYTILVFPDQFLGLLYFMHKLSLIVLKFLLTLLCDVLAMPGVLSCGLLHFVPYCLPSLPWYVLYLVEHLQVWGSMVPLSSVSNLVYLSFRPLWYRTTSNPSLVVNRYERSLQHVWHYASAVPSLMPTSHSRFRDNVVHTTLAWTPIWCHSG